MCPTGTEQDGRMQGCLVSVTRRTGDRARRAWRLRWRAFCFAREIEDGDVFTTQVLGQGVGDVVVTNKRRRERNVFRIDTFLSSTVNCTQASAEGSIANSRHKIPRPHDCLQMIMPIELRMNMKCPRKKEEEEGEFDKS